MIGALAQVKESFFDRKKVERAADRGTRRVLSKFGAFVRRRAQTSIRKRKAPSAPGQPPSSHLGLLRKFIFFAYDEARKGVVIGPTALNIVYFDRHRQPATGTVPEVLEYGGEIGVVEVRSPISGKWRRRDFRFKRAGTMAEWESRYRRVRVAARPYMRPAFEAERPGLSRLWRNAIAA